MKLKVDDKDIFTLEKWQEEVIKNDILEEEFQKDMMRRAVYSWEHKFERCYERFEKEWLDKIRKDPTIKSIPTDKKAFVEMVVAHPEYKNRSAREKIAKEGKK